MNLFSFKYELLWTDACIYLLVISIIAFLLWAKNIEHIRRPWRHVIDSRIGIVSLTILMTFVSIGILDSIHYRSVLPDENNSQKIYYSTDMKSVLDKLLSPLGSQSEKTYSAPFATTLYVKEAMQLADGTTIRDYPHLKYAGLSLNDHINKKWDIIRRILFGALIGFFIWIFISMSALTLMRSHNKVNHYTVITSRRKSPLKICLFSLLVISLIFSACLMLANGYHILGTNKIGQDVFYLTIKSIRTGLIIGTLTTLIMMPFAIAFGTMAGYFGGIVDDVIQYLYTTLSSIPGVLLIAASVLSLQVFITNHTELFPTLASRADARLLALCVILGITSWTSLCRLLRAETLKLRELDFIKAARALGVTQLKIILKHIIPNVMHIVFITLVLDFSGLVLAEAVLSYVGVGVDPTTISWGNMINSGRLELAREPIVWWPLVAAFILMFILVLSANLFSDVVRDAFNPKQIK